MHVPGSTLIPALSPGDLVGDVRCTPEKSASRPAEGAVNKMRSIFSALRSGGAAANIFYYPRIWRNKLKENMITCGHPTPGDMGWTVLRRDVCRMLHNLYRIHRTFQIQASAQIGFRILMFSFACNVIFRIEFISRSLHFRKKNFFLINNYSEKNKYEMYICRTNVWTKWPLCHPCVSFVGNTIRWFQAYVLLIQFSFYLNAWFTWYAWNRIYFVLFQTERIQY